MFIEIKSSLLCKKWVRTNWFKYVHVHVFLLHILLSFVILWNTFLVSADYLNFAFKSIAKLIICFFAGS